MPEIVDHPGQLTPEWFTAVLRNAGALAPDAVVTGVDSERFGTGQVGLILRSQLSYDSVRNGPPGSLIVKLPAQDPTSRQLGLASGAYETEVRFYQAIAGRTEISVPEVFWGDVEPDTGRFTLVLEDLSDVATVGDIVAGGTPAQASAALSELVKLQAPLWDSPELRKLSWLHVPERVQRRFDAVPSALPSFVPRFADRLDHKQLALIQQLAPNASKFPAIAWTGPLVVVHSDFRLDNLLFRPRPNGLRATVVDWQLAMLGPPLIDVCLFLGSGMGTLDRRAHEQRLLEEYHDNLSASGVNGFTIGECRESYRRCSLYGLLMMVAFAGLMEQTERGDAMIAAMVRGYADLIADWDAADVLV